MNKIKTIAIILTTLAPFFSRAMLIPPTKWELHNYKLFNAASSGNLALVKELIPGAFLDARYENLQLSALWEAAQAGHFDIVVALVDAKASVNIKNGEGATPLMIASEYGHTNIVEFLLNNGAGEAIKATTLQGRTALHQACQGGKTAVVQLLLPYCDEKSVNMRDTYRGSTPFLTACFGGHEKCVDLLMEAKADISMPTTEGFSPLYVVSQEGNLPIAQKLIQANPQMVNVQTKTGKTPLFIACLEGKEGIVDLLLEAGAQVTLADDQESLPLLAACEKGTTSITKKLIARVQATANAQNKQGLTPLHFACAHKHPDLVALLLENKANPELRDIGGKTAFDYADKTILALAKQCLEAIRAREMQEANAQDIQDGGNSAQPENQAPKDQVVEKDDEQKE
jgi:ankyrin repeat protein